MIMETPLLISLVQIMYLTSLAFGQDTLCRFGDDLDRCAFKCYCTDGCDEETGECLHGGSCQELDKPKGLYRQGMGCRIDNVASGKTAEQENRISNTYAMRTIDGNLDTSSVGPDGTCTYIQAPNEDGVAWLRIKLGEKYIIHSVTIYNIGEASKLDGYLDNFDIFVENINLFDTFNGVVGPSASVMLNGTNGNSRTGTILEIRKQADKSNKHHMAICEVVIMGYVPVENGCDNYLGCTSCTAGKRLPDCKRDCEDGWWGDRCIHKCPEGCREGEPCHKHHGSCFSCHDYRVDNIWKYGSECQLRIGPLGFRDLEYIDVVPVLRSMNKITWRFYTAWNVTDDAKQYIKFKVYHRKHGSDSWTAVAGLFNYHTISDWQYLEIQELNPTTLYEFDIAVLRQIAGKDYENEVDTVEKALGGRYLLAATLEEDAFSRYFLSRFPPVASTVAPGTSDSNVCGGQPRNTETSLVVAILSAISILCLVAITILSAALARITCKKEGPTTEAPENHAYADLGPISR